MSGRRSNGEGTIYFNKARKCYEGQVSIRDPRSGKTTRRKVSGPTKARVLELIQEVKERGSRGSVLPTTTRVGDWIEHWIADVLPSEPIKESTRASYINLARRYLTPEIGGIRLTELQPADVRSLMTKMGKRELKGNTVRLARTVLNRALKVALVDGHITRKVAALTTGPRKDSTLQRTMTPEQVAALLEAASGDRIEALIHVLLATGLRRSEVLGLSWRDVDLVSRPPTISVVNALTAVNGRLVLGSPKTSRTRRRIFIPDKTADILKALKSRQNRERLVAGSTWGEGWSGHDFVFTTPLGTPLDPSNLRPRVGRILKDAGIGHWKIHEFRHTIASLMIAGGDPLGNMYNVNGKSSILMTDDKTSACPRLLPLNEMATLVCVSEQKPSVLSRFEFGFAYIGLLN